MPRIPLFGTRSTARGSLDWSPKQLYSPLFSPMAFHQAYSPTFKSQSKLAAFSFLSCSPRSCSPSLPKRSVQMKSPHPCLGMAKENQLRRKHLLDNLATVPSQSHLTVKLQTSSMRLSGEKRTESEKNCLRKGFKQRKTGSRMVPPLNFHSISSSIPKHTGLPQSVARY